LGDDQSRVLCESMIWTFDVDNAPKSFSFLQA
jgi:hypothetical protein